MAMKRRKHASPRGNLRGPPTEGRNQRQLRVGEAIRHALGGLGFSGVSGVRQGKVIELDLTSGDADAAKAEVARMCEGLLANTVIEKYAVEIV